MINTGTNIHLVSCDISNITSFAIATKLKSMATRPTMFKKLFNKFDKSPTDETWKLELNDTLKVPLLLIEWDESILSSCNLIVKNIAHC
ncbi:hypothetical protein RCL_jg13425.t1 [Rhizophagus clarus]|uniref:Uncharacterized protein n=1 Tax=Rhizophagus clarus TaxID=94130 RepID=A0A8H3LPS7_9GLOM|nr:hypothetical protein RCL_jg13425.t1 [Rhizophagus clarus]